MNFFSKKTGIFFLIIAFMGTLFITSCKKKQAQQVKTLHISFHMEPTTVDPRKGGDLAASALAFMLYSGLMREEPDGSLSHNLAKSHEISKDQKTYIFHIRKAQWSDGHPITAYDFESSWKKILSPDFPALCPQLFYCIKNAKKAAQNLFPVKDVGIKAKNDKTLIIELEYPTPYFLHLTSFCIFFPIPSYVEQNNNQWDLDYDHLITSGPFQLYKWKTNNEIILKKNPLHWNQSLTELDYIHVSIVDNENTALNMFEKKQLDWLGTPICPLPIDAIDTIKNRKEFSVSPVSGTIFCSFKMDHVLLKNKNLRKALSFSLNRQNIVDNISQQNEIVATRCIPPVMYNHENRSFLPDNQIILAKQHLVKALKELNKSKQQIRLSLLYGPSNIHKKIAETLKAQWEKNLEIHIQLKQVEEKVLRDCLYKHQFDISIFYWIAQFKDPINILERFTYKKHPKNYCNWEDETYIRLLEPTYLEIDPIKRKALLERAEQYIMDELPICPLYHLNYSILAQPYTKNISVGPIGEIFFEQAKLQKK